jgi:hypothetical protein
MSILPVDGAPVNHRILETPAPVVDVPSHADAVAPPAPTEEQVQAIDGAFLRQHQEQQTVASLIGFRLSLLLMHDLAKDAVPPAEDDEASKQRPEGQTDQTEPV